MKGTNWTRLLGIALTLRGLAFLYDYLFANGIVVRGKGFPYPIIDPRHLGESAVSGAVTALGRTPLIVVQSESQSVGYQRTRNCWHTARLCRPPRRRIIEGAGRWVPG